MSVKMQTPSLRKLCSFFKEIPEVFSDKTDVDSYFYHNNSDIFQSQHRLVLVIRGSNKKSFAIKLFEFCDLKTQQRYNLQLEVNISERELTFLVDGLRDFLKTLITLATVYRFPYRNLKLRLDLQSQKTISLLINMTLSLNIRIGKFAYRSDLETSILAFFYQKTLNYKAISLFLQKLSTLTIAKFTISTRTDITLQRGVKQLRTIAMCSAFTLIMGMTIAL